MVDLSPAVRLWDPEPGWLNTASYGLPPRPAWDALQAALAEWRGGRTSWEPWDESTGRARDAFERANQRQRGPLANQRTHRPMPHSIAPDWLQS